MMLTLEQVARYPTHMPSVIMVADKPQFLFTISKKLPVWKSYYMPLDRQDSPTRVGFKNSDRVSECSPDGFVDSDGQVNLSITENYELVWHKGASLDDLSPVVNYGRCVAGTVLPDGRHLIIRHDEQAVLLRDASLTVLDAIPYDRFRLERRALITRISFMCEDPDLILITMVYGMGGDRSFLLSLSTKMLWEITTSGQPVYKCTIFRNKLYFAKRDGAKIDDRYIVETSLFDLTPV